MAAGVESPSHPQCRVLADYLPHSESQRPRVPIPGMTRDSRLYPGCPGCHTTVALLVSARPALPPRHPLLTGLGLQARGEQLGRSRPQRWGGGEGAASSLPVSVPGVSGFARPNQDAQETRRKQTQGTRCSAPSSLHLSEPRWP